MKNCSCGLAFVQESKMKWEIMIMTILSVLFVLCFSYSTSPLYFHDGYDSAVFQSMGLALLKGKIPYVDLFDHKGPILYFINALGLWIGGGKIGIVYLQIIANTISFLFINRTLRLFVAPKYTVTVFCALIVLYALFYREGAHCEEWMLTCISTSLYISLNDFLVPTINKRLLWHSAYYGFCLAMCFLIRPNDAIIYIGGLMFGVFLWLLKQRLYRQAFLNAAVMAVTFVICALPSIVFYAYHNALDDMWYAVITYNTRYAGGFAGFFKSIMASTKLMLFTPLLFSAVLVGIKQKPAILFVLISQIILAWLFTGERLDRHYWISLLPLISFVGIAACYWKKITFGLISLAVAGLIVISIFNLSVISKQVDRVKKIAHDYYVKQTLVYPFYAESENLFSFVPQYEQDQIWNYNLGFHIKPYSSIFVHHGVVQCNRVPFYLMVFIDETLRKSDDVKEKTPKWIMLSRDKESVWLCDDWQRKDWEFIKSNYECVAMTDPNICEIELWKLRSTTEE